MIDDSLKIRFYLWLSPKLNRVMFAMTFIISDVVSSAKTGIFARFCIVKVGSMYRWQSSIQASIPWRTNSARPKLRSAKRCCWFNTCERNDSYCCKAPSSQSDAQYLNVIFSFFFCAARHVLSFLDEQLCQIFP